MKLHANGTLLVTLATLVLSVSGCTLFDPMGCKDATWSTTNRWEEPGLFTRFPVEGEYGKYSVHWADWGKSASNSIGNQNVRRGEVTATLFQIKTNDTVEFKVSARGEPTIGPEDVWWHLNQTYATLDLGSPTVVELNAPWVWPGPCGPQGR